MKIYTRTGDDGKTSLFGNKRVSKSSGVVECLGELDELNACIGICLVQVKDKKSKKLLLKAQHNLFCLGSSLAIRFGNGSKEKVSEIELKSEDIVEIESAIDAISLELPALTNFILPGGSKPAAYLHLCRCVCRRAERCYSSLSALKLPVGQKYLNRLSDLLFVLARLENKKNGVLDVKWKVRL